MTALTGQIRRPVAGETWMPFPDAVNPSVAVRTSCRRDAPCTSASKSFRPPSRCRLAQAVPVSVTEFLKAAALAKALQTPISAHCAPAMHLHICDALHLEWFHDHVRRLEQMLFHGVPQAQDSHAAPDPDRPGFGLELHRAEVARHAV